MSYGRWITKQRNVRFRITQSSSKKNWAKINSVKMSEIIGKSSVSVHLGQGHQEISRRTPIEQASGVS